jgi:hypothetical protein
VVDKCCICKRNEKSVDHLLHCEVVCTLWNAILSRFGLSWVIPFWVIDLFAYWWTGGHSRSVVVRKIVSSCLLWCLGKERNNRNFEDQ